MKYHIQTKNNNCYPTTLACLLDLEIEEVPNFETLYFDEETMQKAKKVLKSIAEPEHFHQYYNDLVFAADRVRRIWLASKGYREVKRYEDPKIDQLYMCFGDSTRDLKHVVIYKNGYMMWDVHHTRSGLKKVDYFITLEKCL